MSEHSRERGCILGCAGILAICFCGAWVLKQQSAREESPVVQTEDASGQTPVPYFSRQAVTLAPGVHLLGGMSPSAAYVIEADAGLVLIDSGLDATATKLSTQLSELGLSVEQLQTILLTHVHADHSLGARRLRELSGAKVYAASGDADVLEAGESREAFLSTFEMPEVILHATDIDERLEDGMQLDLGNATITCISTPGHTPGSFCFLLEKDKRKFLFSGDTISSRTGELGTYATVLSPRYGSDAAAYLASFRKLREMPSPHYLLPGHPEIDRVGQPAEIRVDDWLQLLDGGIAELAAVVERFEADGRDFLDGIAKPILPDLFYLGEFHDWAVYCFVSEDKLVVFDAPGESGLADFIRQRLAQLQVEMPANVFLLLTACDSEATAGLAELYEQFECTVVATTDSELHLLKSLPPQASLLTLDDFKAQQVLTLSAHPLTTLGVPSTAYQVQWRETEVLISGRGPTRITDASVKRLRSWLGDAGLNEYQATLKTLRGLSPDIWLPAWPTHGQNANLYENEWRAILVSNQAELRAPR